MTTIGKKRAIFATSRNVFRKASIRRQTDPWQARRQVLRRIAPGLGTPQP